MEEKILMEKKNMQEESLREERCLKKEIKRFLQEEDGIGVVEVILILVVIFTIYMGCK